VLCVDGYCFCRLWIYSCCLPCCVYYIRTAVLVVAARLRWPDLRAVLRAHFLYSVEDDAPVMGGLWLVVYLLVEGGNLPTCACAYLCICPASACTTCCCLNLLPRHLRFVGRLTLTANCEYRSQLWQVHLPLNAGRRTYRSGTVRATTDRRHTARR